MTTGVKCKMPAKEFTKGDHFHFHLPEHQTHSDLWGMQELQKKPTGK